MSAAVTVEGRRRRAPLIALLGGNAISLTGNVVSLVTIPWFVLETTGSAARTGVTAFSFFAPVALAAFFGGPLVDRLGFRRVSIIADLASGVTVALIPLLAATVGLGFWQLQALVFLGALLDAPGTTARGALLPDLAQLGRVRLERANAATQAIARGSSILGAPLAGVLIATVGTTHTLWLNAASFLLSAAAMALFVPSPPPQPPRERRFLGDLAAGLRWIRGDRLILTLVVTVAVTNFIEAPIFTVVLPVYAERYYGTALSLGLLAATQAGGAFLGVLLYGAFGPRLPRRRTFIAAFVLAGLSFWVLPFAPPLGIVLLSRVVSGVGGGPLNPILSTVFQERVPVEMRGRVLGLITAVAMLALPAGVLLGGVLIEAIGLRSTLFGIAACYLLATLSFLLHPVLRQMDHLPSASAAAESQHPTSAPV